MANKYMNSADRAEDNRSSAWTLLIVGGLGLAVIVLGALGVLPIPMRGFSKGLSMFVLGGLCVLFIIMGIVSFKKSKVYVPCSSVIERSASFTSYALLHCIAIGDLFDSAIGS